MTDSTADKTILGGDLTSFSLQAGFVEGISIKPKRFKTLQKAYEHIFRNNKEYAIFIWNGLPVRLNYHEDIPALLSPILKMLQFLLQSDSSAEILISLTTLNLKADWWISEDHQNVVLQSKWKQINGAYESALNALQILTMPKVDFLAEWKILLQQLQHAFETSGHRISQKEDQALFESLKEINSKIPHRGRFYKHHTY